MVHFQFERKSWWQPHSAVQRLDAFALSWFFILTTASAFDCYSSIIFKFFHYLISIRAILRCWLRRFLLQNTSLLFHDLSLSAPSSHIKYRTVFTCCAVVIVFFFSARTNKKRDERTIHRFFSILLVGSEFRRRRTRLFFANNKWFFACELHAALAGVGKSHAMVVHVWIVWCI